MARIRFEWDESKNRANKRKHRVSFEEAQTVFWDENGRLLDDPDHSKSEDRFILMGLSNNLRVLVVPHTYRKSESVIRIISARRANRREQHFYRSKV